MKILIVCSYKQGYPENVAPFVLEQVEALKKYTGVDTHFYLVRSKGAMGYLSERKKLLGVIDTFRPNIVHAHYGLCGLLANLQRTVPVVTTYHGSDLNMHSVLLFSKLAIFLSSHNIFVSKRHILKYGNNRNCSLIPCGVNLDTFIYRDKVSTRNLLRWNSDMRYILFAGSFDNPVKSPELAQKAISKMEFCELIEMKGYSRDEVSSLLNAADLLLMTSITEGSPQIIKEAMACGCPIVSVDVGDVKEIIGHTNGCYITDRNPENITKSIKKALMLKTRTDGREKIISLGLDNNSIATKVFNRYNSVLSK